MNANTNSIEVLPARIATRRIQRVRGPVAAIAIARVVGSKEIAPSAEPPGWLALQLAHHHAGEFWETLSYLVLWLSGLIAISFCWL